MINAVLLKAGNGFFIAGPTGADAVELEVVLGLGAAAIVLTGAGRIALENGRTWNRRPAPWGVLCLIIGVAAGLLVFFLLAATALDRPEQRVSGRRSGDAADGSGVRARRQRRVGAQRLGHRPVAVAGLPRPLRGVHLGAALGQHVVGDVQRERAGRDVDEHPVAVLDQADHPAGGGLGGDVARPRCPDEPPENRPSVIRAHSLPSPAPLRNAVGCSISCIPGPPAGPS